MHTCKQYRQSSKRSVHMRIWIALVLCIAASFTIQAQESPSFNSEDPTFIGGIAAGGNFCNLVNDYFDGTHRVGLNAGPIMYIRMKGKIWSSLELRFSRKGAIGVRTDSSIAHQSTFFTTYFARMDYMEAPVAIHFFNKRFYHFSAGFTYSYLLSSEEVYSSLQYFRVNSARFPFEEHHVDLMLGGGLHVNRNAFINIRYQRSVSPVRKGWNVPSEVGGGNQYSSMFTLQLVYLFRKGVGV